MYKLALVVCLIALAIAAPVDESTLPCANRPAGTRLPHPTDTHKFLRCVTSDTLWVETCPDDLFYNPSLQLCDWSVISKSTTPSNEIVKHRPVLVKVKPVSAGFGTETVTEQDTQETGQEQAPQETQ